MEKGQYGYMKHRQDHNFRMMLFCAACVLVLVGAGFLIWHRRANLLMVPAMLCVIPMANYLASYVAIAKYHTPTQERYAALAAYEAAGMLLCDLVIVDEKGKRAGVDFAVVYKNGVVAYQSREGDSKDAVEITVNDTLKRRGIPMRVKVYKDWNEFLERLSEISPQPEEEYARRMELTRNAMLSVSM